MSTESTGFSFEIENYTQINLYNNIIYIVKIRPETRIDILNLKKSNKTLFYYFLKTFNTSNFEKDRY